MIKSYKEITGKYLKANKKRTVLTLVGIVLSVALISSIGFFFKSMQEAQVQDMKNTYGSWHVAYKKIDENLLAKIKNNPNVLRSGTFAKGEETALDSKLKVREVFATDDALQLLPYKLEEGRYPEKKDEVALEKWFLGKIKYGARIGDTLQILDKKYTLVGILKDTVENQYNGVGEILTRVPQVNRAQSILLVELRVNKNLGENLKALEKLADKNTVGTNAYLLAMQGEGMPKQMIYTLLVIISIVVVSTIAVIYNTFQISVVERIKQFGLLRAVGSTPRQIRKIILREATFLAVIGVPLGTCFGIVALYVIDFTFKLIMDKEVVFITPTISLDVVLISILVGAFSIYASAMLPAIFAGRISPLVAISSRNSISKEKLKRRKSRLTGKIFGFEGDLASKNIKRNRKRYRTTVFSIVISVTLFITFKAFMDMSLNVYTQDNESGNIHFSVVTTGNESIETNKIEENTVDAINKLPQIKASYRVYNPIYFDTAIDVKSELSSIRDIGPLYKEISYNGQNKAQIEGSIVTYDAESLEVSKKYLKEGSIDINKLNRENGVIIIGRNRIYNQKTKKNYYGPIADVKVGDEILLQKDDARNQGKEEQAFGKGKVNKVKVLAVLSSDPFTYRGAETDVKIITTAEVAKTLTGVVSKPVGLNVKLKDVKLEEAAKTGIENIISKSSNLRLINIIDQNRNTKSVVLMVKILLYGFVIVVSLIGSVNIINTLTTNIILRKREFAALKCIGLTQKGLRKMITLEGMLYGVVGGVYGAIIGIVFSYAIYNGINGIREQSYRIPIEAIAIAAAGVILIGYLSVLAPLKRMKKENLIDAVREDF